jgi:hypothetical protein
LRGRVEDLRQIVLAQEPERDQVFAKPPAFDLLARDRRLDIADADKPAADENFAQPHDPLPALAAGIVGHTGLTKPYCTGSTRAA